MVVRVKKSVRHQLFALLNGTNTDCPFKIKPQLATKANIGLVFDVFDVFDF